MHLKSLTLLGFKSFADKTTLSFQPGITCIVGPNGCGKSNVADAVRWVLGEQSAKALRGGEMADVIFTGTDNRKSLAMAEVSLTISDVDQDQLRAAGVELNYHEVTVTRRVFRDGGSEYYINRTPCRLKDIQQLFMGTGVGRTSYSIMAQGNITQILSSKPEERRLVFEEAAGITRFKTQKREALRKLEYTEQNLLRISDLIREVKRQIGSLQRQAGKARRYKQLQQELQHLDTQLARHQFDVLQFEIAEREQSLELLRGRLEKASAQVAREESEILQLRARLTNLEHEISQSQQTGLDLRNQIERHEHRIQFNQQRLNELEAQHSGALNEIAQAEERRNAALQELQSVRDRLERATRTLEGLRQTLRTRQDALQSVESASSARQQDLRESQTALFATAQHLSRLRNEVAALDLVKQSNLIRLEKLSSEKIQLEEERAGSEARLTEFTRNVEDERQQAASRRLSLEEQQARLRELQERLDAATRELEGLVQDQAALRSRRAVLAQLDSEHEGFGAGAVAALKLTGQALGSLADRLRVPDSHVVAIESALGHHLQVVLTQAPEAAQQILASLAAHQDGRASVVPLSWYADPSDTQGTTPDNPHGRPALEIIDAAPEIRPFLERLLDRTRIVDSLEQAAAAWSNGGQDFDYVTRGGDILSRHGVFTGGSARAAAGTAPSSILGRKNLIAELEQQLTALQSRITEASRSKGQWSSEQTSALATLQSGQTDLQARQVAIATHEGEVAVLQNALRVLHQKIDTVLFEVQSLAAQEEESRQKREVLAAQISTAETEERRHQHTLDALNQEVETLRLQREAAAAALTEVRVSLASEEQLFQALDQQQIPLTTRLEELAQLIAQRSAEIAACLQRRGQAEAEIADSRQRIGTLEHQRDLVNRQTAALDDQRKGLAADVQDREERLRDFRRELNDLQEQRSTLEIDLAQRRMSGDNLRARIQEKYQLRLDDIRSECITITLADQGQPRIRTLTPEEMAAAGASTDWAAVAEQVRALEQRLVEIGPVNLVAIEEYEETEQRHQFLTKQYDDLVHAKQELQEVISRINTQTRTMFLETFEKIRENFTSMFTEVFGGGKADLRLVDEGDVLETGIDIVARPPGKQLQTISLLSGGEQTMTAVALLFAIYQVKPSPFCVLDELDAPLDESNINRFIRILQRFLQHSQFIIITHNKRTIGMGDVLYGVTMQEQGVSSIVSVKFHKADQLPATLSADPLVPPADGPAVEDEEDAPHNREETLEYSQAR